MLALLYTKNVHAKTHQGAHAKSSELFVKTGVFPKYGVGNILLKDHWEDDKNAIGLTDKSERYLAYISTIGDNENEFFLELDELLTKTF
jgi:hypothetical protein